MQIHTLTDRTFRHARRIAQARVDRLTAVAGRRPGDEGGPSPVVEMLGVSLVLMVFMALAIVL
jgi:hypothetical protein